MLNFTLLKGFLYYSTLLTKANESIWKKAVPETRKTKGMLPSRKIFTALAASICLGLFGTTSSTNTGVLTDHDWGQRSPGADKGWMPMGVWTEDAGTWNRKAWSPMRSPAKLTLLTFPSVSRGGDEMEDKDQTGIKSMNGTGQKARQIQDFLGGIVVKNPPANTGSIFALGRPHIPQMPQQEKPLQQEAHAPQPRAASAHCN